MCVVGCNCSLCVSLATVVSEGVVVIVVAVWVI